MSFSIIQKSQLEGANRLDAEYYQPEYLESMNTLNKVSSKRLLELTLVTDGNHLSIAEEFVESGIRYLRGKDLQDFYISNDDPIFIPEKVYQGLKRSYIYKEDVLVSIVGTVGLVSIVADDFNKLTGSCKIAILHTKKVDPWFLAAFLASKYGQNQIQRKIAGAVQTGIILKDLSNVLIPILSSEQQERIKEVLEQVYKQQLQSEALYSQAENLLLKELGLNNFKIEDDLSFVVNFSDVKSANRIDADYFQPKYKKIVENINKYTSKFLTDVVEISPVEFDSHLVPEGKFKYVELSSINSSIGLIDGYTQILGKEAPSRAKRLLKKGDVIVSSVEGSLGKVALVGEEQNGYLASTGFFQFRSKEILPEVMLVLAKSFIFQLQLQKYCAGTILTAVPSEALSNLIIPVLLKETQEKITVLVQESHEARKKSKELLEEAKRKVEEMIEKGGKN